ncbi:RNase P modulator RnpM [Alkalibacterium kapii]|uniref:DNA-binding protein n=1 Tax=Alkalibacterium kapii TaxID=426704 RepID=A0A511ARR9_9LACT|nr:YlxR family protein [Alkalibacterium kapii]GEK90895.1 DNA-binding protein [Alkalibacterium kapii]
MQKRKVPMRKCVVSGQMKPKKEMVRIVRNKEGEVSIDPTGKKNGRGAYISLDPERVKKAKEKKILDQALNTQIDDSFYDELVEYIEYKQARMEIENEQ